MYFCVCKHAIIWPFVTQGVGVTNRRLSIRRPLIHLHSCNTIQNWISKSSNSFQPVRIALDLDVLHSKPARAHPPGCAQVFAVQIARHSNGSPPRLRPTRFPVSQTQDSFLVARSSHSASKHRNKPDQNSSQQNNSGAVRDRRDCLQNRNEY